MPSVNLTADPTPGTAPSQVFLGRQPIYDRAQRVCAYELLYRDDVASGGAHVDNAETATAHVVVNYLLEFGVGEVTRGLPAFVNFSREGLESEFVDLLSPASVVIEVLESVEPDAALAQRLLTLSKRGFRIALDDFVYHPKWEPLLRIADIVKVELIGRTDAQIRTTVGRLRRHKVALLAEKVESHAQFNRCRELGFEMFQGYFLCRPETLSGNRVPASRLGLFELASKTQNPDVPIEEIEDVLKRDPYLSVRLLRMVNSARFSLVSQVSSIRQAVVLMGFQRLSCLAATLALTRVEGKPPEILRTATIRGYYCESLAQAAGQGQVGRFYLTGLCSTLDALFDSPLDSICTSVSLDREIVVALLYHEGPCGAALKAAIAYEHGSWRQAQFAGLGADRMARLYWEAVRHADEVLATLAD